MSGGSSPGAADPIPDPRTLRLLTGTGSNLRAATERSVTLLRVFLLASAAEYAQMKTHSAEGSE